MRQFSTSSIRSKLVVPPLQVFGVDGRYATALYSAATKQKKLDLVEKDLKSVQDVMKTDTKFVDFVADPTIKKQQKLAAFEILVKKQKMSDLTLNLFAILVENGRVSKLNGILNAFGRIMRAQRGEVMCEVITAKPLDSANEKELQAALNAFLKKGETLHLQMKVDPNIIGGMIVSIGDKYVDMSMSSKIRSCSNIIRDII